MTQGPGAYTSGFPAGLSWDATVRIEGKDRCGLERRYATAPAALRRRAAGGARPAPADLPPAQTRRRRAHPAHPLTTGAHWPHHRAGPTATTASAPVLRRVGPQGAPACRGHRPGRRGRNGAVVAARGARGRRARRDEAFPLTCPRGGADWRIIAFLTGTAGVRLIFDCLSARPPRRRGLPRRGVRRRGRGTTPGPPYSMKQGSRATPLAQPESADAFAPRVAG
jgi:hypothetical protein